MRIGVATLVGIPTVDTLECRDVEVEGAWALGVLGIEVPTQRDLYHYFCYSILYSDYHLKV